MSHLAILRSPLLSEVAGVRHGFFSRRGGVSQGIYQSLNVGLGSKDDPAAVAKNRARAAAAMGAAPEALLTAYQVHSAVAVTVEAPWSARPEADAVVTGAPSLVCGALSADCAPVLLADGEAGVVGAAHAGWRGALGGIVEGVVAAMEARGARRGAIVAAVGPCIAQASYEVGLEFLERFAAEAPGSERFFAPGDSPDKRQFDLAGFVLERLAQSGVRRAEWIGRDTVSEEMLFFSNRRAMHRGEGDYGRLLSAISLTGPDPT
ncbi:MAG TPA: peptidoglycan editing factor PgeF [Caulobacteraceae bacterium]|nr:peptidoglycan editing factor PgeF [Caulobacteraceae bacterium]